jgi:hypothetical protein
MMRIVARNCNMALERKVEALLDLRPDIAAISDHVPVVLQRRIMSAAGAAQPENDRSPEDVCLAGPWRL